MQHNIFYILFEPEFHNFDNVKRFNGVPVIKQEPTSQHSWWVTMFCKAMLDEVMIMNRYTQLENLILRGKILEGALLHDYVEVKTGDVNYNLKYNEFNGAEIKEALTRYENHILDDYMRNGGAIAAMAESIRHIEGDILVKKIIKIGDWLAIIKNELQEIRMGNRLMESILDNSITKAHEVILETVGLLENKNLNSKHDRFSIPALQNLAAKILTINPDYIKDHAKEQ